MSNYVKEGTFLDLEAFERGTSVYLPDRVIPMLPKKLSNGICSLNEGVDRLVMGCEIEINELGDIVNSEIFEGIINSKHRMTYDDVNKIINNDELLVNKDSGITKIEDLKGKTIATQLGTSGEVILNLAIESVGMSRDEVNVVNMEVAGVVTAFISGQVDAVAIWSPNTNTVRDALGEDKVVMLASNADFVDKFVFPSSWVVTEKYAGENRDVLVRFTKALLKSMDYRNANIEESAKLVGMP